MKFESLNEKQQQIAHDNGYCGLFAERDNLEKANEYVYTIIETLGASDRIAVITAVGVLTNAWATKYAENFHN